MNPVSKKDGIARRIYLDDYDDYGENIYDELLPIDVFSADSLERDESVSAQLAKIGMWLYIDYHDFSLR
jgi:hypothetical protein